MGFIFKNLYIGEIVSSNGGIVFRKLSPLPTIDGSGEFDLNLLGLAPGTYWITVTAFGEGLEESDESNMVVFTVN